MKLPLDFVCKIHNQINFNLNMYFSKLISRESTSESLWPIVLTEESIKDFEINVADVSRKYYSMSNGIKFNPLNSDHMSMLLYLLSRKIITKLGDSEIADSISYLNRIMHGIDVWHSVELPKNFIFIHPVGTILGKAKYSDFVAVYQGVTVGSSNSNYPTFNGAVILYSNVSILGNCQIGENTIIGANTILIDKNIPPNSSVWNSKELVIKKHFENIQRSFMHGES